MSQPPVPISKGADRLIRVSELGDWVYCNLAWKLKQLGVTPTEEATAKTEAGRAWHQEHGEVVVRGGIRASRPRVVHRTGGARGSRGRSPLADRPNAIWQADHTPLDILFVRSDDQTVKPWLNVVIDDYSRAVAGYFLSFEDPSALHTSLALRQAIWRKEDSRWIVCGIPDVLYTDNGSDFTSRRLEQVGADLKIRVIFSIPGQPQGRGRIERFFSTVNEMFLCELDGYAPAGGAVCGKPTLTLADFDAGFRRFLFDVYHRRANAETKTPPAERWEANGFLPRMPDSLEQLDLLLIQVAKARQVRADGIHFQSLRYISTTLAAFVGEMVTLRFDPRDMAEVRVFHENTFLCRAVCAELAGSTVPLREILRARNHRRRELRGVLRDRQAAVDTMLDLKRGEVTGK